MNLAVVGRDWTRPFRATQPSIGWKRLSVTSTTETSPTSHYWLRKRLLPIFLTNIALLALCACCGPPAQNVEGGSGAAMMSGTPPSWPMQHASAVFTDVHRESEPGNLGDLALALVEYHDSGAYDRDTQSVVGEAIAYVAARSSAAHRPALVLDIDETALSNWDQLKANGFAYFADAPCVGIHPVKGPCGSKCWDLSATTPAVQAILRLYRVALAHHVTVFFITGRHEEERVATESNLRLVGYEKWQMLYMKPTQSDMPSNDHCSGRTVQSGQLPQPVIASAEAAAAPVAPELSAADFKASKRQEIVQQGYTIIANVGDQPSDLAGGFAERAYLLPNPYYRIN